MGYGAVRDAHKRGALPLELFENLPDDDPDARNGLERERAEVEPLQTEDVKQRLLGHWGASPALSFVWLHLNRMIVKHDLDMIFVAGPRASHLGRRLAE